MDDRDNTSKPETMHSSTLEIRLARLADIPTIHGLIQDATQWLNIKGTQQWQKPWPTKVAKDESVLRAVTDQETWLLCRSGSTIGSITVRPTGCPKLWGASGYDGPCAYVHRLVTSRAHSGNSYGARLLDWAAEHGSQAWGAQRLRLDAWTDNYDLHRYYKSLDFEMVGIAQREDNYPSCALFQRPTSVRTTAKTPISVDLPNRSAGS
jgi:GNAT superfamily N-acetyltransferase